MEWRRICQVQNVETTDDSTEASYCHDSRLESQFSQEYLPSPRSKGEHDVIEWGYFETFATFIFGAVLKTG